MSTMSRAARALAVTLCLAGAAACGGDDTTKPAAYTPVSDVDAHAAIGADFASIKQQLANAKDAKPVDWAAVKTSFSTGGASKKSDGTNRTLASLVKAPEAVAHVTAAIDGGEETDAVRAQRIEKGITALRHVKILDEIEAAKTKLAEAKTDPKDGAPHNVDEAWAFYTAGGNGVQSTAVKRGDDFKKPLDQPILAALTATQTAAVAGNRQAFDSAHRTLSSTLNHVFYLATYKYLDTGGDPVRRAEGESFYLAIAPTTKKAAPEADAAIIAAFASGDAKAGRAALNSSAVTDALELDTGQTVTT